MTVDWHSIILSETWLSRLEIQATKRFGQAGLAEEATTHVLEQLARNDWVKCHSYTGKAKPETFLYTLTNNLLEEFARNRFGRPRPPEWLKREGDLWVSVWKMVCLERQLVESVIDRLVYQGNRQRDLISAVIKTIKAKLPWCGSSHREIPESMICGYGNGNRNDEGEIESNADYGETVSLEQQLDQSQLDESLLLMSQLFSFLTCPSNANRQGNSDTKGHEHLNSLSISQQQLDRLYQSIQLTDEEQLLLKMVYQEGLKMNVIAKSLSMPSYQPGRLLKGILKRIEQALNDIGLPMESIKKLLQAAQE
ncbi:hypothetical protein ACUR5C_08275 [Aliikangiella sp. IMCC44653]